MTGTPHDKDLVLVGGGHSHVHVLKMFGMRPLPGVRLTLVTRTAETPYSGMLPGFVAGCYDHDQIHLDLVRLARFAGARLVLAEACGLDRAARRVLLPGRPPLRYDLLSLDIGSTPRADDVPGALEHVTRLKPVDRLAERWRALTERVLAADHRLRLVMVGGGAAGIEVALGAEHALRLRLRAAGREALTPAVALVTGGRLLAGHAPAVRTAFLAEAARRGVAVREDARVARVEAGALVMADDRRIPFDECLWATQAAGAPWLAETGLALDDAGFVLVTETLQSVTDPLVLAAGDVATMVGHPRPKAGVMAVRQGPPLTENLRRLITGQAPQPFRPQKRFLALIGTGDGRAVASRGRFTAQGAWVWRWKDHVDRTWMRKYQELPEMRLPAAVMDPDAMRCADCGGKVAADVLRRALARLGLAAAPADAAEIPVPPGARLVQSVDHFRAFVGDPWLMGRIAAVHALSDLEAMGARPVAALAIVGLPAAADGLLEDDLVQVLDGARSVLPSIVGGHTAESDSMTVGFAVTGALQGPGRSKGGLRPGEALVLTKPLGTGTLLAAAMRGRAKGRWVAAALDAMAEPNAAAAAAFTAAGVTGCTDVTGFGLLGHLVEMLEASGVDAEVDTATLPALDGAAETLAAGLVSSLHPANLRFAVAAEGAAVPALLTDPQTAGGLLAGVPADRLDAVLAALPAARVVGRVTPRAGTGPQVVLR
ncbi:selenide, water dikinase SelD [Caenispirillum bisanense]|uniref:selenide, water dikinase SelD n=1 Tax=Caenispirillum bisanense TaxID=414052 RepID=UPI001C3E95C8|nr:selenide, water dikinase SelD [Caenispirillum bisanense]